MKYLYAVLIVGALFSLYVWLRRENRRTPVPAGCENLSPECGACGIADCAMRKEMMIQKEEHGHA